MSKRVWFITGISRGLGYALAHAALERGDLIVGTTRDGSAPYGLPRDALDVLTLDLDDHASIPGVVEAAFACHGRIDVLVNNAGYGLLGSVEASSDAEARHLFDIDFFAPLSVIRSALPRMRRQGSGHIVNISSIAGIAPASGTGIYGAAKAALSVLSDALSQEIASLGLWVTCVTPGAFRTEFLSPRSMRRTNAMPEGYGATSDDAVAGLVNRDGKQPGDPAKAALAIIQAVYAEEPPLELFLGSDALRRARIRLDRRDDDIRRWEDLSLATDFEANNGPDSASQTPRGIERHSSTRQAACSHPNQKDLP